MMNHSDTVIHKSNGMYLNFADGLVIDLSKVRVHHLADEYWSNPAKLPPHIRQDDAFMPCDLCPSKGQNVFCSTLKPLLPFLEEIDKFHSYDKVTAVYVKEQGLEYISETVMQDALQYVTNMSIFEYCEGAKQYHKYFKGIEPFTGMNESRSRLFLNIYWLNRGDRDKIGKAIEMMRQDIMVICRNSVKRLNLLCRSDAFINAYIRTHTLMDMLAIVNNDSLLEKYFCE